MNHTKLRIAVAATAATSLIALSAVAQSGQARTAPRAGAHQKTETTKVDLVEHDKILGAAVVRRPATDEAEEVGTIADLVLDARSGDLRYAVLATGEGDGEKKLRIGWHWLSWDGEESRFTLRMAGRPLDDLPAFDPQQLRELGRGAAAEAGSGKGRGVTGGGAKTGSGKPADASSDRASAPLVLASEIAERKVTDGEAEIGTVETLFIVSKNGAAAFASVTAGGIAGIGETEYLIPWRAMAFVEPADADGLQVRLAMKKSALASAPTLGDDGADVDDAAFRKKVYRFFGVEAPTFDRKKMDDADGQDSERPRDTRRR